MVILAGLPAEGPVSDIGDALENLGVPFETIFHRNLKDLYIDYAVENGKLVGELCISNKTVALSEITGIYNRMMDFTISSDYKHLDKQDPLFKQLHRKSEQVNMLINLSSARVMNKNRPMSSNSSKVYQMMLIQKAGFKTPESCITNNVASLQAFLKKHKSIIYKSASGIRSIVHGYTGNENTENLKACPVLFQQKLIGKNYRVHVVGDEVFTSAIETTATDYRYAGKTAEEVSITNYSLQEDIRDKCIALSKQLELPLAGIDLMQTENGEWYCFEVNPSPGYTYYEAQTGQPIARTIAKYLAGINE